MKTIKIDDYQKYNDGYIQSCVRNYFANMAFTVKMILCIIGISSAVYVIVIIVKGLFFESLKSYTIFFCILLTVMCCGALIYFGYCLLSEIKRYIDVKKDMEHLKIKRIQLNSNEFTLYYGRRRDDQFHNQSNMTDVTVYIHKKNQKYFLKSLMKLKGTLEKKFIYGFCKEPITVTYLENSKIILDISRYYLGEDD